MIGRTGYQILSFEDKIISQSSPVVIPGAFAKAKSRLPVLITELNLGGVKTNMFSSDSSVGSTTVATLPVISIAENGSAIVNIQITSDDKVTLVA